MCHDCGTRYAIADFPQRLVGGRSFGKRPQTDAIQRVVPGLYRHHERFLPTILVLFRETLRTRFAGETAQLHRPLLRYGGRCGWSQGFGAFLRHGCRRRTLGLLCLRRSGPWLLDNWGRRRFDWQRFRDCLRRRRRPFGLGIVANDRLRCTFRRRTDSGSSCWPLRRRRVARHRFLRRRLLRHCRRRGLRPWRLIQVDGVGLHRHFARTRGCGCRCRTLRTGEHFGNENDRSGNQYRRTDQSLFDVTLHSPIIPIAGPGKLPFLESPCCE